MTTQNENNNYCINSYNLISYECNNKYFDVKVYKYIKNDNNKYINNTNNNILFNNTEAYYKIKTSEEKVLLINNNNLEAKDDDNNLDVRNNNWRKYNFNKYFMLINIDGWINDRRYNIIPFKENPTITDNIINDEEIINITGGQIIKDTFYIINTYGGDIERNFKNIRLLINGYIKLVEDINNIT